MEKTEYQKEIDAAKALIPEMKDFQKDLAYDFAVCLHEFKEQNPRFMSANKYKEFYRLTQANQFIDNINKHNVGLGCIRHLSRAEAAQMNDTQKEYWKVRESLNCIRWIVKKVYYNWKNKRISSIKGTCFLIELPPDDQVEITIYVYAEAFSSLTIDELRSLEAEDIKTKITGWESQS